MVKGVNKTIIEINNTGSKYFDRVLLFVNPAHIGVPQPLLEHKAAEIIKAAGEPGFSACGKKQKSHRRAVLFFGICGILLAAVAAFIIML